MTIRYGRSDPRYYYAKDFGRERFPHPLYPDRQVDRLPSSTSILSLLDKPALRQWAANCAVEHLRGIPPCEGAELEAYFTQARFAHKKISKEARDKGTDIHSLCAKYLSSLPTETLEYNWNEMHPATGKMFEGFVRFCEKHHVKPLAIEKKCWATGWGCRLDVVWEIDNFWSTKTSNAVEILKRRYQNKKTPERVVALCDFKTGKGRYYHEWGLQLAANTWAFNTTLGNGRKVPPYVRYHGILKFNKETLKVNYKDYSPLYERDLASFGDLMRFYWRQNQDDIEKDVENNKGGI